MNVRKEFNNLNLQYNRHSFYFEIDLLVTHHYRRACFMFLDFDYGNLSTPFTTSFLGNNFRQFQRTPACRWF